MYQIFRGQFFARSGNFLPEIKQEVASTAILLIKVNIFQTYTCLAQSLNKRRHCN